MASADSLQICQMRCSIAVRLGRRSRWSADARTRASRRAIPLVRARRAGRQADQGQRMRPQPTHSNLGGIGPPLIDCRRRRLCGKRGDRRQSQRRSQERAQAAVRVPLPDAALPPSRPALSRPAAGVHAGRGAAWPARPRPGARSHRARHRARGSASAGRRPSSSPARRRSVPSETQPSTMPSCSSRSSSSRLWPRRVARRRSCGRVRRPPAPRARRPGPRAAWSARIPESAAGRARDLLGEEAAERSPLRPETLRRWLGPALGPEPVIFIAASRCHGQSWRGRCGQPCRRRAAGGCAMRRDCARHG